MSWSLNGQQWQTAREAVRAAVASMLIERGLTPMRYGCNRAIGYAVRYVLHPDMLR